MDVRSLVCGCVVHSMIPIMYVVDDGMLVRIIVVPQFNQFTIILLFLAFVWVRSVFIKSRAHFICAEPGNIPRCPSETP